MEWDIDFKRQETATWIEPGFHSDFKEYTGQVVTMKNGVRARVIRVEFHIHWPQLKPSERKQIKARYGDDAKRKFHQFTRVHLERMIEKQMLFPGVNWFEDEWD